MSEEIKKKQLDLNGELSQQDALGILIQGVRFGQTKGIYSLEDAAFLSKAIAVFLKQETKTDQEIGPEAAPLPKAPAEE